MNKTPWLVCSNFVLSSILAASAFATSGTGDPERVIYGDDDRQDIYQVTNSRDVELASSTVVLIKSGQLTRSGDRFNISADTFQREFGLCETEPFKDQYSGGFCSGALVGDDLMITAGHCITGPSDCAVTKFVFGYAVTKEGEYPTSALASEVYGCSEIIERKQEGTGADYAVVRIDRKVTGHKPLKINRVSDLKNGDNVGVIGHPSGLPVKVAFGKSEVRNVSKPGYFIANLDTYGGNSGSAVFNTKTGLIEGILVRGETDFKYQGGCRVSNVCSATGCRGEDVTKISALATLIPETDRTPPTPPTPPAPPSDEPTSSWPTRSTRTHN